MLRTMKAQIFTRLLTIFSIIFVCYINPAFAVKKNHSHTVTKQAHSKHHADKKNTRHHGKHLAKKHHRAPQRHAQVRNNIPESTTESAVIHSVDRPLNHDLAAVNITNMHQSAFPGNLMGSVKKDMADFVQKTVENLHYSSYKLGGKRFDPERGIYILDCSNFVDHILKNVYPEAYSNLVDFSGADTPASGHYFNFFHDLAYESEDYWNKIDNIADLRSGDVLVFRYKNSRGAETGGHVMVVMDKPERASDVYFVRVADSAHSRHSKDTRGANESGIGIGTLLLKANPKTGKPSAFAWGINSYWNKNVKFAMARPMVRVGNSFTS